MDHAPPNIVPLGWSHAVQDIPASGLKAERTATSAECIALASELGILECRRLAVHYEIRPRSSGRYLLSGTVKARIVQSCVVTLEPVESALVAAFEVEFWPPDELSEEASRDLDPLETIEVEVLEHGRVPVGRITYEHIAAALDPYPRAPNALFSWNEPEIEDGEALAQSPFDVLKQLRPKT